MAPPEPRQVKTRWGRWLTWLVLPVLGCAPTKPAPPPAPRTQLKVAKDGSQLIHVPAGAFTMGSETGEADEAPVQRLDLPAFWIALNKVTNGQFASFLSETGYSMPGFLKLRGHAIYWDKGHWSVLPDRQDEPVTDVPWSAALAYCAWASPPGTVVRLPSEAEWEKAARGTDGRTYPWGNSWDPERARWGGDSPTALAEAIQAISQGHMSHVTRRGDAYLAGASPYKCLDMAGNAWEWCSSKYAAYPYCATDGREELTDLNSARVIRGGSAIDHPSHLRCSNRFRLFRQPTLDFRFQACTGFRVAASDLTAATGQATPAPPLRRREAPYFQMLTSQGDQLPPEETDRKYRLKPGFHPPAQVLGYPLTHEREMKYFAPIEHFVGLSAPERRQASFDLDRYLKIGKGQVVADLGAGSGVFISYLAQAVGPSGQVWATEISASALRCILAWLTPLPSGARAEDDLYYFVRPAARPPCKVYLVLHDLNDCLLVPRSLDLACLIHVHYFQYPHAKKGVSPPLSQVLRFYRSVARSLKSSGRMAILDWSEYNPAIDPEHGVLSSAEIVEQMRLAGFSLVLHKELSHNLKGYSEVPPEQLRRKFGKRLTLLIFKVNP